MADYSTCQEELVGLPCDDQSPHESESSPSPTDDRLSKFLETFTPQPHYSRPESKCGLFVFWSQNLPSQNKPSTETEDRGWVLDFTDPWEIHKAIKSAFCKLRLCSFDGLIQFWVPVETGSRRLLTTCDQPFALNFLDSGLRKYRLCSLKYQYNIDANNLEVGDDSMIVNGAPANAFINHLAEVVMDMRVHHGSPLVRSALECELMCCFVLPICDPSQSRCVGVVECSANKLDDLLEIFNHLNSALQRVGLCMFHGQERVLYERIGGLKHATDEIEEALHRVCEAHDLTLAQVWISDEDGNHDVPLSTLDTQMKRMIPLKLIAHCDNSEDKDGLSYKDYYGICDMLPLKIGEGLVGKAHQNYVPHLCRNIYEMSTNEIPLLFPITITERSCFVICLRSIETGNLDYVFEFLWLQSRNYIILLESLILTLKRCLPNFKFASGAQLGDELCVLDFKFASGGEFDDELSVLDFKFTFGAELGDVNSVKTGMENFTIFKGKKSSPIPTVLEKGMRLVVAEDYIAPLEAKCKTTEKPLPREEIEQQFGKTMKEAAQNLKVSLSTLKRKCKLHGISEWQGPSFANRKVNDLNENRCETIEEDNGAIQGPWGIDGDIVTIKAEYEDDVIKFHLPISLTTFKAVEKEIGNRFQLKDTTYKLKYLDEDKDWILMICEQDMSDCIKISRSLNDTRIKLRVLRST